MIYDRIAGIIILLSLAFILLAPALVLAHPRPIGWSGPIVPCGNERNEKNEIINPCQTCHLFELGHNIVDFLLYGIALPLAILMIIIGGVIILTSAGNPNRHSTGTRILTNTILGLVIAFAAWLIINTIIVTLAGGPTIRGLKQVWYGYSCPK